MPNIKSSRKRKWIIAATVVVVLLIALGIYIYPTISLGLRLMKYGTTAKCRAAIAAGDTDPIAYENLAAFQMADRHDDEATKTLRQCLKANPNDGFAKSLLSGTLADNGHGAEAIALDKELAQTNDDWGKKARRDLHRNHISGY